MVDQPRKNGDAHIVLPSPEWPPWRDSRDDPPKPLDKKWRNQQYLNYSGIIKGVSWCIGVFVDQKKTILRLRFNGYI